jgi:hypothetical protein
LNLWIVGTADTGPGSLSEAPLHVHGLQSSCDSEGPKVAPLFESGPFNSGQAAAAQFRCSCGSQASGGPPS